ncbi:MAG: hypothetical protein ABI036_06370 [Fibrobacteria bacterium]
MSSRILPIAFLSAYGMACAVGDFPIVFSASNAGVREFLATGRGGPAAKLVFVDNGPSGGPLCYIDFSDGQEPAVRRIAAAAKAKVPVISPDGNWVVYATGLGGPAGSLASQRSSVYLCRLAPDAVPILIRADSAYEPRFAYLPGNPDVLRIIYPTLAPDCAWEPKWGANTMRVDVDVSGAEPVVGLPEKLAEGGYSAGLSYGGKWISGGGDGGAGKAAMLDLSSGRTLPDTVAARFPLKEKASPDYPRPRRDPAGQACNVSASPSRVAEDVLMYLDFGSDGLANEGVNGGQPWEKWELILLADRHEGVPRTFRLPRNPEYPLETSPTASLSAAMWHHPEWSNHPYFAVATLNAERYFKDPAGTGYVNSFNQERIVILNLRDSAFLEVLRPGKIEYNPALRGVYWPWLWVQIPDDFQEDGNWLAASIHPAKPGQPGRKGTPRLERGHIVAASDIESVTLRSATGARLAGVRAKPNQRSVKLPRAWMRRESGIVIDVRLKNGSHSALIP